MEITADRPLSTGSQQKDDTYSDCSSSCPRVKIVRGEAVKEGAIGKRLIAGAALAVVMLVGWIICAVVWLHERRLTWRSRVK
jgi:hypothetical protein